MTTTVIERVNAALSGRYRVERGLGEGGMATVYLARDEKHNRNVALKVLKPELAAIVGGDRFLTEIETTANLQHPHILPLFDSGEADGFLYYVMPYVEGETLRARLHREHQLPVEEAVRIATNVAEALDYAHRHGVIHRDIKPANILLQDGKPVVSDFGIALAVGMAGGGRLTETGLSLGTPHYMAPEQATGDVTVGPASDLYALGCVLYEMLAGEPPHNATTAQAVLAKMLTGEVIPVTERRHTVPPNVAAAVRKALERLPADRFASGADLCRALSDPGFRYGEVAGVGGPGAPGVSTRWRTVALAAGVLAVASTAVALTGGLGSSADEPARRTTRVTLVAARTGEPRPLLSPVAISPDGRHVAYLGTEGGRVSVYRRALDRLGSVPISGSAPLAGTDALPLTFSPDGRSLAFGGTDGVVRRVPIDGGGIVPMAHTGTVPLGMSWSEPYGVVMGMFAFDDVERALTHVTLADTTVQRLVEPADSVMQHDPWVLPGGEFALYTHHSRPSGRGRRPGALGVISLGDRTIETHELDPEPDGVAALVGVAEGVLLYFDRTRTLMAVGFDEDRRRPVGRSVPVPGVPTGAWFADLARDGTLVMAVGSSEVELSIVNDRGNEITALSEEPFQGAAPRFSPDGARLAVAGVSAQDELELWTYDLATGPLTLLAMNLPLRMAAWTGDSRRLLVPIGFDRERQGRDREIWSRAADASDQPRVEWEMDAQVWVVEPAPDGGSLALVVSTSDDPTTPAYDIVIRPLEGDTALVPFAAGPANEVAPRFSPDGRWLAYASNESGRYEVYARPFPGPGGRVQVSDAGGGAPVWSADGNRLFYRDDSGLVAATVDSGGASTPLRVVSRARLFEADLLGGLGDYAATYDVHPDGQRFAIARPVGAGTEIVLWLDWLDEVKALLER